MAMAWDDIVPGDIHKDDSSTIAGIPMAVMLDQNELYNGVVDSYADQVQCVMEGEDNSCSSHLLLL